MLQSIFVFRENDRLFKRMLCCVKAGLSNQMLQRKALNSVCHKINTSALGKGTLS